MIIVIPYSPSLFLNILFQCSLESSPSIPCKYWAKYKIMVIILFIFSDINGNLHASIPDIIFTKAIEIVCPVFGCNAKAASICCLLWPAGYLAVTGISNSPSSGQVDAFLWYWVTMLGIVVQCVLIKDKVTHFPTPIATPCIQEAR